MSSSTETAPNAARRRAMEAFAAADTQALLAAWQRIAGRLEASALRGPEAGLIMLRGRIGGGGAPFNLGEASVARASVRLASGEVGHAMVLGRDAEHARLAALFDAGWQRADWRGRIETEVIAPTLVALAEADRLSAEETEATRVDFFTMLRGEDD
ncbi:phosphonate C-P lyase system protein PhnG [Mangrovibrevibacter kandeliae]|uniref:phosphonate C-P lyase system protein PhnG n=1 Tax=Mangrovibrevibacter kandeliae TaxID=2968473 RepID=UPI0021179A1E|nr:phosphonate C-P lyase system protein PhnG [Aurantimonas sp. CSK15Z-1]MCQ8781247.1 phosphonate C-P lyase system protein PhnG [Aurantimonas sp. CSK15Z-1]